LAFDGNLQVLRGTDGVLDYFCRSKPWQVFQNSQGSIDTFSVSLNLSKIFLNALFLGIIFLKNEISLFCSSPCLFLLFLPVLFVSGPKSLLPRPINVKELPPYVFF